MQSIKAKFESFLIACDALEEAELWDKAKHGEMDSFYTNDLLSVAIRMICADGVVAEKEILYFNETLGMAVTRMQMEKAYEGSKDILLSQSFDESFENGISLMRRINAKLADLYKEILLDLCRLLIESDDVVLAVEESELLKVKAMFADE